MNPLHVSLCFTEEQGYLHTLRLWLRIQSAITLDYTQHRTAVGLSQSLIFCVLALKSVKPQSDTLNESG